MKTNPVKQKLKNGEPTFGTWLSLGDLYATRVLARLGFDWLTLDMEHSAIDWHQASMIFAAVADAGCVPVVRVPEGNHHFIKRALDAGAWGVVVPMVNDVEQAKRAIAACKYPPLGNRSVGGGMHTMNFDATPSEYYNQGNDEILVVLQTESPEGVRNAKEIYSLPGCDAIFIGPNDLRYQMYGESGEMPSDEAHEAMIQEVIRVGKETGTPTGIHAMVPEDAFGRVEQGMQFIALSSDLRFMTLEAQRNLQVVRPNEGAGEIARY